ncbi:MAG: hypothetical protein LBT59_20705 [Clostridiales bacterium]|jgi:tetratricopeptide (TPR) repeat protein|nr:hypothetical protein [Clostridiales bacterium]
MFTEKHQRARWFFSEASEALSRGDNEYAKDCLDKAHALLSPQSESVEELDDLSCILLLKSICDATPVESAKFLKESIRIEENLLGSRKPFEATFSCANLASKYNLLGDHSKAIGYADRVDIENVVEVRGMPDILFSLYETYTSIRGRNDSRGKESLEKAIRIAERFDDYQKCVAACIELAHIALHYGKDKASAFSYCEKAWTLETWDGIKGNLGVLHDICKTAWDCIPKDKGVTWTSNTLAALAALMESDYMSPEIAKMYLISVYTLELKNPDKEKSRGSLVEKCLLVLGNDRKILKACMSEAALRAKSYL